jgi:hypothetical protein
MTQVLFYSGARQGEDVGERSDALTLFARACEAHILPDDGIQSRRRGDTISMSDMATGRDIAHFGCGAGGGIVSYAMWIVSPVVETIENGRLKAFLTELSSSLGLDVGRTYLDPDTHSLWPDEKRGNPSGVGWFQYFGPALAARLPPSAWRDAKSYSVEMLPNGARTLCLKSAPLEEPPLAVKRQVAKALGFRLRPR